MLDQPARSFPNACAKERKRDSSDHRFRGLLIRWSKKAKNHLAFLHLACGIITWRIIGPLR